jgi:microcin C transport system permease protein
MSAIEAPRSRFSLSPISARRWANFKANRRGFWSLWIFLFLFVIAMGAEFIANDKPILVSYKGELLTPVFVDYPEEKFGGFFAVTDYRDPVIQEEIASNGWALWPPIRYSYRTVNNDLPGAARQNPPSYSPRKSVVDATFRASATRTASPET